jgi:hypothetical protein
MIVARHEVPGVMRKIGGFWMFYCPEGAEELSPGLSSGLNPWATLSWPLRARDWKPLWELFGVKFCPLFGVMRVHYKRG